MPWTYQSMLHELFGISNNIVKSEEGQITLEIDSIFEQLMYLNFGDFGSATKSMTQNLLEEEQKLKNITNEEELK